MKDFKLSIIMPCYNERDHIGQIVEKVIGSPIKNKEIIVVDDKSTDGSSGFIDDVISPMVTKVIHHKKMGGKERQLGRG